MELTCYKIENRRTLKSIFVAANHFNEAIEIAADYFDIKSYRFQKLKGKVLLSPNPTN